MIDMHAHWRPAELIDALRDRAKEPRILRNQDGAEVLKTRVSEEPLAKAFDDAGFHLARMERQGVSTSVLSLLGAFCWIQSQPVEVSVPLCRLVNDALSGLCQKHEGRFSLFAALPLMDMPAARGEFERALALPGVVGAQLPGNAFLTRQDAEEMRPLMEVAIRLYVRRAYAEQHGAPRTEADLSEHRLISYSPTAPQPVPNMDWLYRLVRHRRRLITVNNYYGVLQAARNALGVAAIPDYMVRPEDDLVHVAPGLESPHYTVFLVYPEELRGARRITLFRDFMLSEIEAFSQSASAA